MSRSHLSVIVLCGVVGSGKTFFSKALCSLMPDWVRVSQDDLGSRPACEAAALRALKAGQNVIVDRCNFDRKQRKTWIAIAQSVHAEVCALELNTPVPECRRRIMGRTDHPTGVTGTFGTEILAKFVKDYKSPSPAEGFSKMLSISTTDLALDDRSLRQILERLGIEQDTRSDASTAV